MVDAATFEVKNIQFSYVDYDKTTSSNALLEKFRASTYFNVVEDFPSKKLADDAMEKGNVEVILEIPPNFENNLIKNKSTDLAVYINAIDGAKAGLQNVYVNQIIRSYNQEILINAYQQNQQLSRPINIEIIPSFWYNNTLNYKTYMVPGILVLLVTMITLFLSGMNIVREKEMGTLEQINVTPIKKYQFIIGKLFPFWVLGMLILTVGLIIDEL